MTDGSRNLMVIFEMVPESGKCLTPCPHGMDCMVYSFKCECCEHFFGRIEELNIIKCTGARSEKQESCS